ncbi:MAG TPA: hypothetical protein VGU27_00605 [Candidatus Eisenbacteria bacterium]|nr:hypothetical protein [Candidatus Eisenbacteria bacterium]
MSQLVPYVPPTLAVRARRAWPIVTREAAEWGALLGLAVAALGSAAAIAVIAMHTWRVG